MNEEKVTGGITTGAGLARPFYDPALSYQENYDLGPFGPFAEQPPAEVVEALALPESEWVDVAGLRLRRPVGIPSGPLLNAKYVAAAFRWGYDLAHYKTVRTTQWPSHEAPNVLRVDVPEPMPAGELGRHTLTARPFREDEQIEVANLSITNSFGMPAQPPDVWQADMEAAARAAGPGQALVASVTGTPTADQDAEAYIRDHARAAAMVAETGVHAVEVNLSCPNIGGHGLLCHDPETARRVVRAVREAIGPLPLFAKIGDFPPDERGEALLRSLVSATAQYVQAYSAVNAVPAPVSTAAGEQALPGAGRAMAGVAGAALRATGLDVVRRLDRIRREQGYEYAIVGVGGMMSPTDYLAYREAGADAVQGATGPMWNHALAVEIARNA